jgi:hypothetical protein
MSIDFFDAKINRKPLFFYHKIETNSGKMAILPTHTLTLRIISFQVGKTCPPTPNSWQRHQISWEMSVKNGKKMPKGLYLSKIPKC